MTDDDDDGRATRRPIPTERNGRTRTGRKHNGCRLRSPDRPRTSPFSAVGIGRPTRRTITLTQDAKFTKIEPERRRGVRVARGTGDAKESKNARIGAWRYVEGERVRRHGRILSWAMDDGIKKRMEEDEGEGRASVSFRFVRLRAFRRHGCDSSRARMDGWMDGWMDEDGGKQTRKTRADAKKIEPTE